MEVRRLCARKEEIYGKLLGNHKPPVVPGVPMFLETLVKHNVRPRPAILCSNRSLCSSTFNFAEMMQLRFNLYGGESDIMTACTSILRKLGKIIECEMLSTKYLLRCRPEWCQQPPRRA